MSFLVIPYQSSGSWSKEDIYITMKNDAHYMWVLKRLIKMCALKKVDD